MEENSLNQPASEPSGLFADEKTVDSRKEICNNCENNKLNICTLCGCFIPGKIRLTLSKCPANLW